MDQIFKKTFKKKLLIAYLFFQFVCTAHGQVITLGTGSFTGSNFAGPANTSTVAGAMSRYAYIFPAGLLNTLKHGDSIRSLSFMRNGGGSLAGTSNLKIFIRTTVNNNYGNRNINWVNQTGATGMKKVYDGDPATDIGSANGWVRFTFSSVYVVDTVLGKNLELLVEFRQTSSQSSNIFWTFENSGTVGGYQGNQVKFVRVNGGTITDTTNSSTELHPTMRIEFPQNDFDISVLKVYSLGKLPVPLGNPDTVKAIIANVGKKAITNFKVYLVSKGSNHIIDSGYYSLGYLEQKLLNMPLIYPTIKGLDTLTVMLAKDQNNTNNQASTLRIVTENIYSYKDPAMPIAGGIGFNGSTGDFVAKFQSNTLKSINQISVSFSGINQKFKLGIWKADGTGGAPGTNVWTSDTLISKPNFITPVWPPVPVNGAFFVGVRQIGLTNVAFGYQPDVPVRPGTFYYTAPTGDTNWVDFSPDAPYKFVIEPRLQAKKDIAPISLDFPKDTIKLIDVVKMAPKATILNYGSEDQLVPFTVKMTVHRNNILEFSSTRQDTLSSGRKHKITFDSTLLPNSAGDYMVTITTALPGDEMKDNDTFRTRFVVAVFKDVGPGIVFDPSSGFDYEQNIDTIYPTVYIQNYGLDQQGPFNVTAQIFDSLNNLVYSDVKPYTLSALNSVLASFTPFPCSKKGFYKFVAFTSLAVDVDKANDTVRRTFRIVKSNDVAVTAIIYPKHNKSLQFPVGTKQPNITVENLGDANQGNIFPVYCNIYYNDSLVYSDSATTNSFRTIPSNILFKNFKPANKGYYRMVAFTSLYNDQIRSNDTMVSIFAVGVPDDIEILSITPVQNSTLQINNKYATSVTVRNNGYNPQNNAFPIVFKVSQGASITYAKVINITIDSGETKTFIIDTSLALSQNLNYDVLVYSMLVEDFVKSNDTLRGIYSTAKSYDVGVQAILYPTLSDTLLIGTQNVKPRLVIQNFGDSLVKTTFRTTLKIFLASNNVLIYQKTYDTAFSNGSSIELTFPGFSLSGSPQDIKLKAYTELLNDQFHANDSAAGTGRFMLLRDAVAVSIINPQDLKVYKTSNVTLTPNARIRNQATVTMPSVLARLIIRRVDTVTLAETEVYRDSVNVTGLTPSEVRQFNFNKTFIFSGQTPGIYKSYLTTLLQDDQNPLNNSVMISFRIVEDVGISEVVPQIFSLYPNPADGYFRVSLDPAATGPQLLQILDVNGKEVYARTLLETNELVDITGLAGGTYFVKIGQQSIKIIVQH